MVDVASGTEITVPHPDDPGPDGPTSAAPADRLFWPAVVAALVPIVVATVRAVRQGWMPVGDNAYFLIRARDVLTEHHPLLGTWTSASQSTGSNFNNPGPLLFDVLAVPAKLGGGTGLAIGVAVLNGAWVVGIALMARRQGGATAGLVAVAATALLCWTMGSQLMFDPWQPHSLLLPFLFCAVTCWGVANGDLAAAPWAVGVASFIVQTHLSYAVLVAALGAIAAVGLVLAVRPRWAVADDRPALRRRLGRVAAVSAVVLLVAWAQPLIEQVTAPEQGNLVRVATHAGGADETVGQGLGTRIVADTLTVPPFWLRPSFEDALRERSDPADGRSLTSVDPSAPVAAVLLLLLAAVLLACGWRAVRRADRAAASLVAVTLVAVGAGVLTAWQLPFGRPGHRPPPVPLDVARGRPHGHGRGHERGARPGPARRGGAVAVALAVVVAVTAVANLPTYNVRSGPSDDEHAIEVMRRARPQLAALEDEGPILVDFDGIRFAEPYSGPVMAELQRRGIPFFVDDPGLVRQLGDARELDGDAQRLIFRDGDRADDAPPGSERVVHVTGLDADDQRERDDLETAIGDHLAAEGLRLRPDAEPSDLARGAIDALPDPGAVEQLFRFRVLVDWSRTTRSTPPPTGRTASPATPSSSSAPTTAPSPSTSPPWIHEPPRTTPGAGGPPLRRGGALPRVRPRPRPPPGRPAPGQRDHLRRRRQHRRHRRRWSRRSPRPRRA